MHDWPAAHGHLMVRVRVWVRVRRKKKEEKKKKKKKKKAASGGREKGINVLSEGRRKRERGEREVERK